MKIIQIVLGHDDQIYGLDSDGTVSVINKPKVDGTRSDEWEVLFNDDLKKYKVGQKVEQFGEVGIIVNILRGDNKAWDYVVDFLGEGHRKGYIITEKDIKLVKQV
jgi:hypothetical protein